MARYLLHLFRSAPQRMVNLMEHENDARVLLAGIGLAIGGSIASGALSWLGLFLIGGALLALLLDAFEQLLTGRRRNLE